MGGQCAQLGRQRLADVDDDVGLVAPEEIQAADPVWLEPLRYDQVRKGHGVARGRVDRVDSGCTGRTMVDVVHAAVRVDQHPRVKGDDGIGSEGTDDAHELLTQRQVVGEGTIGAMQERHRLVADDAGSGTLLCFAHGGDGQRVG